VRRLLTAVGIVALLGTHGAAQTGDPVAELARRIDAGTVRLTRDGESGYLGSLLKALDIPVSSQSLVFLSSALQLKRVNAGNPRALYFNDSVIVGWVRGGFIELIAQHPVQGLRFYTLEQGGSARPALVRETGRCVGCHRSARTGGIPALQVSATHARAFDDRFGGWYVTGHHGTARHFGNWDLWGAGPPPAGTTLFNWESLEGKLDLTGYLSPYSDIVALMVMQHRAHITNSLNRVRASGDQEAIATLVDRLLFVDELPLTAPIRGTSGFAEEFQALGPRDKQGRSLRDLDLTQGLMRYPLSYMIYSPQFDALPAGTKGAIYKRAWDVLSGWTGTRSTGGCRPRHGQRFSRSSATRSPASLATTSDRASPTSRSPTLEPT
jgi:hypothetical protein